jgi:hypothetical protein
MPWGRGRLLRSTPAVGYRRIAGKCRADGGVGCGGEAQKRQRACMSSVVSPYRLDLTVSVLRRLSTNAVDLLTPEGMYVHALSGFAETTIVRATQVQAAARAFDHDRGERAQRHRGSCACQADARRGSRPPPILSSGEAHSMTCRSRQAHARCEAAALSDIVGGVRESDRLPAAQYPGSERDHASRDPCGRTMRSGRRCARSRVRVSHDRKLPAGRRRAAANNRSQRDQDCDVAARRRRDRGRLLDAATLSDRTIGCLQRRNRIADQHPVDVVERRGQRH